MIAAVIGIVVHGSMEMRQQMLRIQSGHKEELVQKDQGRDLGFISYLGLQIGAPGSRNLSELSFYFDQLIKSYFRE